MKVEVKPTLLRWACERSGLNQLMLAKRFSKLAAWERGAIRPTLKQLEAFAKATHVPLGYLFLPEPPIEKVPIPDFRTVGNARIHRPSPDLLDTIYTCQQRQEWYRDFSRSTGGEALPFVGSLTMKSSIESAATAMSRALRFDVEERARMPTWTDALRAFIAQADAIGLLVMCSGVVQSNNRRRLDPEEFRGFAMVDALAPLVFINGADTKAAQMFTLAHELAHIWLGESAVSDSHAGWAPGDRVEEWCNRVAAELLVPIARIRVELQRHGQLSSDGFFESNEVNRLARHFKVSTLVILRRIHDADGMSAARYRLAFQAEVDRLRGLPKGSGGDFYLTQAARVSKRFARALVASTLEGQTLHRDAFRMLGFSKLETFRELGRSLGVPA